MKRRDPERLRFFSPSDIGCVQAVHGNDVAHAFPRHCHNGFCLGVVRKGARVIYQGGVSTIIPENGLFVINPGVSHACASRSGRHSYFSICVEAETLKDVVSQIAGRERAVPHFRNILLHDTGLAWRIRHFSSLVENAGVTMEKEFALNCLLSSLVLRHGDEPPNPRRVGLPSDAIKRACAFIGENYARDLSLRQVAEAVHLSPFYFQRLFLGKTGVSPHDYLVQYRIRQARGLLSKGRSIAEVALDTGFVDQSHFTRSFKRVMGVTPGAYLRDGGK